MSVRRIDFSDRADVDRWEDYVASRPDAHVTDLAAWRPLYRDLYGIDNHSFLHTDGGETTGALSLYHIRSPFLGNMLLTCPFFGHGGLHWDGDESRRALLQEAESVARALGVDYVEYRLPRALGEPYGANTDFSEFDLELAVTPETTWTERLSSNVRQNIRKSEKQSLEFSISEDYRPCFGLLRRTLRAHGTPFHGERFFRLLTEHLGERVRFSEVRHAGRVIAAGVVIRSGETIITPYIGSLESYRARRPNYLQYWGIVRWCHDNGVRRFELGRSPRGSTHARFKTKWGAIEQPQTYSYLVLNPKRPYKSVSRPAAIQRLATRVWRHLPLSVTTALGPRLFRYIP